MTECGVEGARRIGVSYLSVEQLPTPSVSNISSVTRDSGSGLSGRLPGRAAGVDIDFEEVPGAHPEGNST